MMGLGTLLHQRFHAAIFIGKSGIKPGNHLFPDFRTREAMESEKVCKALKEGPVGHLSIGQPPLSMGGKMAAAFIV